MHASVNCVWFIHLIFEWKALVVIITPAPGGTGLPLHRGLIHNILLLFDSFLYGVFFVIF